jgi:ubiquinone/menaquinone biosynthesis C-methylase UbiE
VDDLHGPPSVDVLTAMSDNVAQQKSAFDNAYVEESFERWSFHYASDPLTRYVRDRRLNKAVGYILSHLQLSLNEIRHWNVLIVCGGVGGEGTFFANKGFRSVTNSDVSENALRLCRRFDPRLQTLQLNAEHLDLPDNAYDLVVVQDGLHHLLRPVLGYTEMLRVSRKATVLIEPHTGIVARSVGTEWERHGHEVNYVFRWNRNIFEQSTRSYLLELPCHIRVVRLWDHNLTIAGLARKFPTSLSLAVAKTAYGLLALLPGLGNMMIGVVIKGSSRHTR